jgi:hypothetical protein
MRQIGIIALMALGGWAYAADIPPGANALFATETRGPSASAVRSAVTHDGFYAGPAVGAGACARCHADVAAQWAGSAHRFASFNNPYYSASVLGFRDERGKHTTRFCADCHDPLLVADGQIEKTIDPGSRAAQAGIVCLVCHSIDRLSDPRGNGHWGMRADAVAYSGEEHKKRLRPSLTASPTFCGSCHKVGLTEEVTGERWLRGQDDFDAWYDSAVAGRGAAAVRRPSETKICQDCHMPYEAATRGDLAAKQGRIRSHRFLAANSALPHLRGDADTEARTVEFLRGAVTVDLASIGPGSVDVVLRNRRVGHRFPGGTNDSNEVWLEVVALDAHGQRVGASGIVDGDGRVDPGAHRVRAQPVDEKGIPLGKRDVQHMRGVAWDTSLSPADPQAVRYRLPPGTASVRARLLYRKFDRDYLVFSCASVIDPALRRRCESPPIVEMAVAEASVGKNGVVLPDDVERLVDHGLALADGLVDRAGDALPSLTRAAKLAPDRPEPQLGLARVAVALGQTDEAVAILDRLDKRSQQPIPASLWLRATALHHAYRDPLALTAVERLALRLPDDRNTLGLLARLRGITGDARGALSAADRLLAIDPEAEEGLFQRMLARRELHLPVTDDEAAYLRHRRAVETDLQLRGLFQRAFPALADEAIPVHTHELSPRPTASR